MLRLGQRASVAIGKGTFRGLRKFDPKAVFVANAKLGMLAIREMIRLEALEQAAFAPAEIREQLTQEYYQHVAEQNRVMAQIASQTLDRLRHMTWEQVLENGAAIGADMVAQGVFFGVASKVVSKLGCAALGQVAALSEELKTIYQTERAAAAAGKATPISEMGQVLQR